MDNKYKLIQYHEKKLNITKEHEIKAWLESSESNRKEYHEVLKLWELSENAAVLENINLKQTWKQILNQTQQKNRKPFILWMSVASIALLLIALNWLTLFEPAPINMLTASNTSHEVLHISLPDGSIVSLNKGASLTYPSEFGADERRVQLQGNAFFEVKRNVDKAFQVETQQWNVKVLGTSFDVNAVAEALSVTVSTGKVRVYNSINQQNKIDLLASDRATVQNGKLIKTKKKNQNYLAWKTKKYSFSNTTLEEVFETLQNEYAFQYSFRTPDLKSIQLSAQFEHQKFEDIIDIIQLSCQVNISYQSNEIIISNE